MERTTGGGRVMGILAHVDSGKTTLGEALLFQAGSLLKKGRVDHGDSFLDTGHLEKQRGITIFSKIARFPLAGSEVILLDTPGHIDFSPEMERSLSILDYAILVISGPDGVTGRVKGLWQLLRQHGVPVLIFVNKMDQPGTDRDKLYQELMLQLSPAIIDFSREDLIYSEDTAMLSEELMEEYLSEGRLSEDSLKHAITERTLFPVWFGSALKGDGIAGFLGGIAKWTMDPVYPEPFSARVYKISRDDQGRRLTEMKITGGSLKNRSVVDGEKITQLRLYSGGTWQSVQEVFAGEVVAVAGLNKTKAGQGLGKEQDILGSIQPVLSYRVNLPGGGDEAVLLPLLREIEEELPELNVSFLEETGEIHVHIRGEVLLDVLTELVRERGGMDIGVDEGRIIYRETVTAPVLGIGHFEPLRHYAEVHLLLEPNPGRDSEVQVGKGQDSLDLPLHWQNLVLQHVLEKDQPGVLTGAPLANIRITLVAGRGHDRQTTGGDFREATYRAIRQGLMSARAQDKVALLEPMVDFEITANQETSGRILTDLSRLEASSLTTIQEAEGVLIQGRGPAATLRGYQRGIQFITKGQGRMHYEFSGYDFCHDGERVVAEAGYHPEEDVRNPSGSIFLEQGAGYHVPWQEVARHAHIPPLVLAEQKQGGEAAEHKVPTGQESIDAGEVERIIRSAGFANVNIKKKWKRKEKPKRQSTGSGPSLPAPGGSVYLLVDGYNVIHAWPELTSLAKVNFDASREKLQEILMDHQGYTGERVTLVFDAYQVERNVGSSLTLGGIQVIFTRENETADQYIEKKAMDLGRKAQVKVVTSDFLEQMSALGFGALVYSARRFREIIEETRNEAMAAYELKKDRDLPLRPLAELLAFSGSAVEEARERDTTNRSNPEKSGDRIKKEDKKSGEETGNDPDRDLPLNPDKDLPLNPDQTDKDPPVE